MSLKCKFGKFRYGSSTTQNLLHFAAKKPLKGAKCRESKLSIENGVILITGASRYPTVGEGFQRDSGVKKLNKRRDKSRNGH
jgi:hypothetical protein